MTWWSANKLRLIQNNLREYAHDECGRHFCLLPGGSWLLLVLVRLDVYEAISVEYE